MSRWHGCERNALMIYAGFAVAYMLIPIVVIAVFSFGETPQGPAQLLPRRRLHARVLGERVLDRRAERRDARSRSSWRR